MPLSSWSTGVALAIVLAALLCRWWLSRADAACVPPSRLAALEAELMSSVERVTSTRVAELQKQNAALAAENGELRRKLAERRRLRSVGAEAPGSISTRDAAPLVSALAQNVVRTCGTGKDRRAVLDGVVKWRNKHGKFVSRKASVADGWLRICKRPPVADLEYPLARASVVSDSYAAGGIHRLRIRSAASKLIELEFASGSQRREWQDACEAAFAAVALANSGGDGVLARPSPPLAGVLPSSASPSSASVVAGRSYLRFDRAFAHGLGHEALVYNLGVRLAAELNLTLLFEPLLASSKRGDHAELVGMSGALEAVLGLGAGEVPRRAADDARLPTTWLSRPCPDGSVKLVGKGGARWDDVVQRVRRWRLGGGGASQQQVFAVCGDLGGSDKYNYGSTGEWWREKMAAAGRASPLAHATPLFGGGGGGAGSSEGRGVLHVAVHIRRGDMVYRNFNKQLSPDGYYANAMWHVLALARADAAAAAASASARPQRRRVVYHIFSQPPPRASWTGKSKVPLPTEERARAAEYVDELGCEASLRAQLARLAGAADGRAAEAGAAADDWEVRMHLNVDPIQSLLHMARADVLIASDSSFSLLAAVLSRGLVLSRGGWKRFGAEARAGMLHPLTLDDDGSFDCAAAASRITRIS